ncbi:MAG: hypothetical protein HQM03_08245 [Magnetococcales bacterium]|nr:hypothetical protein [Magnetococcales bacterium]
MTVLTEGHLQITLPPGVVGRKFDDASHGLSHCMQAVDFIIPAQEKNPVSGTEKTGMATDAHRRLSGHESGNLESDLSRLSCPTDQPVRWPCLPSPSLAMPAGFRAWDALN